MVLPGLLHNGASISMTVDRSTSPIARAEYSGPPANSRYRPRFTIVAPRATPPPADFKKLLRFTAFLAFEPMRSPPERGEIRTPLFLNAPILQQIFQLAHELLYILKVHVHRSEAHIRHFVECLQLLHDHFADLGSCQFTLGGVVDHRLDLVDNPFQLRRSHRPLLACFQKPLQYFLPFETLPPSVLLDDHIRNFINAFVGREAAVALQAFAAPADGVPAAPFPRIDHFVVQVRAKRTLHEAGSPYRR